MTSFDYVVIGAGTAGLALAARLAENPNVTVCVLEAGEDYADNEDVKVPGLHLTLYHYLILSQLIRELHDEYREELRRGTSQYAPGGNR